jgi:hypothetical protein
MKITVHVDDFGQLVVAAQRVVDAVRDFQKLVGCKEAQGFELAYRMVGTAAPRVVSVKKSKPPKQVKPTKITLHDRMVEALQRNENAQTAREIMQEVLKTGPVSATNPKNYISFLLSKREDLFEKISHGKYRLVPKLANGSNPKPPRLKPKTQKNESVQPVPELSQSKVFEGKPDLLQAMAEALSVRSLRYPSELIKQLQASKTHSLRPIDEEQIKALLKDPSLFTRDKNKRWHPFARTGK